MTPFPRRTCRFLPVFALFLLSACTSTRNAASPAADSPLPTEADIRANPAIVREWAARIMANEPSIRAAATAKLIDGEDCSLPLLSAFLHGRDQDLHAEALEIIRRIGPAAIPMLTDLLPRGRISVRRQAISILIDLAPDTESHQQALARALRHHDLIVARDAARALGALGELAAPSAASLTEALSHSDPDLRLYAAEALASIGPKAAPATMALADLLRDPVPGVRWGACEALASIGPDAAPAIPRLIDALKDEFLYVRLCATGALGSIGPDAAIALDPLKTAADDPTLHAEAQWAIGRIAPAGPEAHTDSPVAATAPAAPPSSPPASQPQPVAGNPPLDWDTRTGRNILWSARLGDDTFGRPVVHGDTVYVGTDNSRCMNPALRDECGVLMAFRAADGAYLWQDLAPRANRGLRDFLLPSTTSAPHVDGDRLYYMTAECQLRCLDTRGFRDGENDGPFRDERFTDATAADMVWELDLCARLGVFPHEASNSEVLPVGDLLIVCTSNGRNEGHTRVPSPRAPSLIAVDKHSGTVVWRAIGAGEHVLHGQWCSPVAANVNGRTQVLFGGGDGWLRAYDAPSGRELWRFDANPKDARWRPRPGVFSRSPILASPVFADGRVFVALGQDPSHGDGPSLLHAISPGGQGDVTGSRLLWTNREIGRVIAMPIVSDGLLYVADVGGTVHCVDAATGAVLWKHETDGDMWGCLLLAGGRLYAGGLDGRMTVLRAGRSKQLLAEIEMDDPLYSRPALIGDRLFLATARQLHLIAATP